MGIGDLVPHPPVFTPVDGASPVPTDPRNDFAEVVGAEVPELLVAGTEVAVVLVVVAVVLEPAVGTLVLPLLTPDCASIAANISVALEEEAV